MKQHESILRVFFCKEALAYALLRKLAFPLLADVASEWTDRAGKEGVLLGLFGNDTWYKIKKRMQEVRRIDRELLVISQDAGGRAGGEAEHTSNYVP